MRSLTGRQWALLTALVLVALFTGFYAVRSARRALYWHNHRDEVIRPWMTLGYVAHSYSVPPHVLCQALKLPLRPIDRRPLGILAKAQQRPVQDLIDDVTVAIVHARPPYPAPSPPPPP